MSAVVVANFNELSELLLGGLVVNVGDVELDTSSLENTLNKYFPQVINSLKRIEKQQDNIGGNQCVKGYRVNFSSGETSMTSIYKADEDTYLTGFSFSEKNFNNSKWSLYVVEPVSGSKICVLDGIYAKDGLQHKYFDRFVPVPTGYSVEVVVKNTDKRPNVCWFDLEYLTGVEIKDDISHDYDLMIKLIWENSSSVDLDLSAYVDNDTGKGVKYSHKEYFEDESNKMWLDYDYTEQGSEAKPEIITVLGLNRIISVTVTNYSRGYLNSDAHVEVVMPSGVTENIVVTKEKLNGARNVVHVCDIVDNTVIEKVSA